MRTDDSDLEMPTNEDFDNQECTTDTGDDFGATSPSLKDFTASETVTDASKAPDYQISIF